MILLILCLFGFFFLALTAKIFLAICIVGLKDNEPAYAIIALFLSLVSVFGWVCSIAYGIREVIFLLK